METHKPHTSKEPKPDRMAPVDPGHGSEVAPTEQAAKHEEDRHAREVAEGHLAAGVDGRRVAVDREQPTRGAAPRDDREPPTPTQKSPAK